jgi:hypothetical protein
MNTHTGDKWFYLVLMTAGYLLILALLPPLYPILEAILGLAAWVLIVHTLTYDRNRP